MSFHSGNFLSSSSNSYMGGLNQTRRSYSTSSSHSGSNGSWSSLGPAKVLSSSGAGGYDFVRDSGESLLTNDEKGTMQNLNDRLASYLEKVRSLEETNAQLEDKIQEWHKSRAPEKKRDYKGYEKVIVDLQAQLANGHMNGAKLTLQMENAKLAADDFKRKYDTEKAIRAVLEKDLEGLRKVMDDLTIVRTDLEMEIEGMRKQLIYMRKSHEEDMKMAQSRQRGSSVSVELDAAPAPDLPGIIADMRKKYEAIIDKNRKEIAERYSQQSTTVQEEVSTNTEALQSNRDQVKELKRTLQTLEIEVQGELSRKYGLENTLEETRASSTQQLQNIQNMICRLEAELRQVRNDNERQSNEYKLLLDIKSRLENEIATYRRLMDGDNTSGTAAQTQETGRKVKTIVQDVVDGRVVFSKVSEIHRKL